MILDSRLGDQLGYFGAKYPDAGQLDRPSLYRMGYLGDRDGGNRPYRQTGIAVHSRKTFDCDLSGPFYTDTDTAGGQSGGPHWELDGAGNRYICGALSISVTSSEWTYAGFASGNQMIDVIIRRRIEYPSFATPSIHILFYRLVSHLVILDWVKVDNSLCQYHRLCRVLQ